MNSRSSLCIPLCTASLFILASCQKPAGQEQQKKEQASQAAPQAADSARPNEEVKPQVAPETAHPAGAPQVKEQQLVPLEIRLPRPVFVGTPTNIAVPNLEKPLGSPRPPFLAPAGTRNLALKKPVTGSDEQPIIGELSMITDGDKEAAEGSFVELGPAQQFVTIDLKSRSTIYAIVVWHYHKQPAVYHDVIVQVADDRDFVSSVQTVFNNDNDNSSGKGVGKDMSYVETAEGKLIDAKGVQGRYVRLYSRGNTANDLNHYIEVEVYGKAAQ